ncbi:transcriptional regulator [Streptomyces cadmiisoli]|uniref:transcriptional regulator n=1 Tax=Streptomyces cadmiisoli TaxID=2184053 RepID=UPI003D757647
MTVVGTTPPPRLPVRDKADCTRPGGVSPMLTRLAGERATGVLVRECGTLYLTDGRVVHAESPLAPGLDVLLTAHGTLDARAWQDAVDRADGRGDADRPPIDGGLLAPGALELCHLSALYDAAFFALAPSRTPGRFHYGSTHWLGTVHPVPVAAVEHETLRRRTLLQRIWPDPASDSAPLERVDTATAPAVAPRQHAVLARVDGLRTATDIARELGRPAFHTLVDVRRLTAAGLVAPRPVLAVAPALTGAGGPATAPRTDPAPPAPGTRSTPGDRIAPPGTVHPTAPGTGIGSPLVPRTADPDIALLKRVRDALEAL